MKLPDCAMCRIQFKKGYKAIGWKVEGERLKAHGARRKVEDRRQRTEDRRQMTEA